MKPVLLLYDCVILLIIGFAVLTLIISLVSIIFVFAIKNFIFPQRYLLFAGFFNYGVKSITNKQYNLSR
jgi:hypothetical protein